MAQITIDVESLDRLRADDRGRVALGTEYAEKLVEVATVGIVPDPDDRHTRHYPETGLDEMSDPEIYSKARRFVWSMSRLYGDDTDMHATESRLDDLSETRIRELARLFMLMEDNFTGLNDSPSGDEQT